MSASATHRMSNDQDTLEAPFSFFKLPLELRLAVYEELFPVPIESASGRQYRAKTIRIDSKKGVPDLLRTCRAIREECAPIFLKHNKFKVTIIGYDTTPCDVWFSFFKSFDTSKIHLKIEWKKCSQSWYRRKVLQLLQAGFKGESHVLPESPLRQWTVAPSVIKERAVRGHSYTITYDTDALRDEQEVDKLRRFANHVVDWRSRGMSLEKAVEKMEELVEDLDPTQGYPVSINL